MIIRILGAIIVVFPLAIMILSIKSIKVKQVSRSLKDIKESLNDYPLSEFEYAKDCRNKYNKYLYKFPGSQIGCTCVNVNNYYYSQDGEYQVNIGECSYNQSLNGCQKVPPVKSHNLENWGNGKFCSKFYEETSKLNGYLYYLNSSVLENQECQNGYKKCGKLDNMGNYLCLPKDEECPINDIIISNRKRYDLTNYNNITIDDKYFYYTNLSDKPIISKLKVMEGKICMNKDYFYTEYPQYILDNNFKYYGCRNKIGGQMYEKDIEILDTKIKEEYYADSNLYMKEYYFNSYFDYPFYSLQAKMNLYPQRYIGYDKKCLIKNEVFDLKKSPFNEEKITQMNNFVTDMIFKNKINMWFSIFGTVFSIISTVLFVAETGLVFLWSLINFLFFIMMAIPIIINLAKIPKFKLLPTCGNRITNIKINYYNSTAKTLKITTILSFIFISLYFLLKLAVLFSVYRGDSGGNFNDYNYNINNENLLKKNTSPNIVSKKNIEDLNNSSDFLENNRPSGVDDAKPQSGYSNL